MEKINKKNAKMNAKKEKEAPSTENKGEDSDTNLNNLDPENPYQKKKMINSIKEKAQKKIDEINELYKEHQKTKNMRPEDRELMN